MMKSLLLVGVAAILLAACGASEEAAAPATEAADAAAPAAPAAEGVQSVSFTLANATAHTLTHLYISPAAANSWETDILGELVLEAGESGVVNINDGVESCMYDFKANFDDGDSIEVAGVDICKIEGETITVSG